MRDILFGIYTGAKQNTNAERVSTCFRQKYQEYMYLFNK